MMLHFSKFDEETSSILNDPRVFFLFLGGGGGGIPLSIKRTKGNMLLCS